MKLLTDYTNHLVFDFTPKLASINVIHKTIKDFDINLDLQLCSHCFYDSKKKTPIIIKKANSKEKNKTKRRVPYKKNKSSKK